MKQRGRRSASSLAIVEASPVEAIPRQPPPSELSAFEAELWQAVVNTKPADWFSADTLPLLRSYVRHCYQASKIDFEMSRVIDMNFTDSVAERFEKLQKMRERESSKIMALARSMRLTQQSQVDPERAHTAARKGAKSAAAKLWDE
jgi:hypothetical protein